MDTERSWVRSAPVPPLEEEVGGVLHAGARTTALGCRTGGGTKVIPSRRTTTGSALPPCVRSVTGR